MGCQSTCVMQRIVTERRCVVASALISLGLLLAPVSLKDSPSVWQIYPVNM